jgi:hypothetical protein
MGYRNGELCHCSVLPELNHDMNLLWINDQFEDANQWALLPTSVESWIDYFMADGRDEKAILSKEVDYDGVSPEEVLAVMDPLIAPLAEFSKPGKAHSSLFYKVTTHAPSPRSTARRQAANGEKPSNIHPQPFHAPHVCALSSK